MTSARVSQSGNHAAESAPVLAAPGFWNVKVHVASRLGYSGWLAAPANDQVWTNVGSLPVTAGGLENRYGQLE